MEIDWSVWGPPAATLVAGGLVATVLLQRSAGAGDGDRRIDEEARRNDLASTRDEVLEALKHLETEREKLPPGEYEAERQRLVARGSRALEALDGKAPAATNAAEAPRTTLPTPPPAAPATPAAGGLAPEWRGALYALAGVALAWLLWSFAQQNSATRGDGSMTGNLPGEQVGGNQPAPDPTQSPEFKARVDAFQKSLDANPSDLEALNGMTQLYMSHGVHELALQWSDKALAVDARNADARVFRAVLTAMMGLMDQAMVALDAVLAENPTHQKALIYKGLILLEQQQYAPAAAALEQAVAGDPQNPQLRAALERARSGGAAPAPAPTPGGGELLVRGTVELDPAAQAALRGGETLFLSLANPAQPGPPVAAHKIDGPLRFPIPFELTTADIRAMPGSGAVPAVMDFKARLDADGNAMTKEPGLPLAVVTGVAKGSAGLVVTLTLAGTPTASTGGAPAGNPMLAPVAVPGGGDVLASGQVLLDPSVRVTGAETVFVSVKDPAGGPPLAVKRLPAVFPLSFSVTAADLLQMGAPRPVPAVVNVTVRVDGDGNAGTKDGPEALAANVSKGATGLSLTVK